MAKIKLKKLKKLRRLKKYKVKVGSKLRTQLMKEVYQKPKKVKIPKRTRSMIEARRRAIIAARMRQLQQRQLQLPQERRVIETPQIRPTSGNILQAPNIMKGEMTKVNIGERNMVGRVDGPTADELATPVTNPYGDVYIEVDIASGKRRLVRRPREKWLSGRQR